MKNFFLALVFMVTPPSIVLSTAQQSDELLYNGKTYNLHSEPLRLYFQKYPCKKPESRVTSTALWRGYIAYWQITNKRLYLRDLKILKINQCFPCDNSTELKSVQLKVFRKKNIFASFVSDLIIIPIGKMKKYIHSGYESKYDTYKILEISKGILTEERTYTAKQFEIFKDRQFNEFKKTKQFKALKNELKKSFIKDSKKKTYENIKEDLLKSARNVDKIIRDSIIFYTNSFLSK